MPRPPKIFIPKAHWMSLLAQGAKGKQQGNDQLTYRIHKGQLQYAEDNWEEPKWYNSDGFSATGVWITKEVKRMIPLSSIYEGGLNG